MENEAKLRRELRLKTDEEDKRIILRRLSRGYAHTTDLVLSVGCSGTKIIRLLGSLKREGLITTDHKLRGRNWGNVFKLTTGGIEMLKPEPERKNELPKCKNCGAQTDKDEMFCSGVCSDEYWVRKKRLGDIKEND